MEVKTFLVEGRQIRNQCYPVYKDNEGLLIDPAWDFHLINDFLLDNRIFLRGVLLTHGHKDHTDLAAAFAERKGVPVYMSAEEVERTGFNCPNLAFTSHLTAFQLGGFNVTPILTPGHTGGSNCYLIGRHLFSGDTVFIEGVGICDGEGVYDLFDSVQFLKGYLPESTMVWPGHSFGDEPGKELRYLMRNNIYFQFEKREQFADFRMRANRPNPFAFK